MYAKGATGVSIITFSYSCFSDTLSSWKVIFKFGFFPHFRWLNKNAVFQENTVFIDTKRIGIIKKKVRKLEDQLDYESRRWDIKLPVCRIQLLTRSDSPWWRCRLWRDVTMNLKLKDIDAATEAKHRLEEKQRAEARERKEKEQQWETRVSSITPSLLPWYSPSRVLP